MSAAREALEVILASHQRGPVREVKPATATTEARYGAFCTCGVMLDARDVPGSLRLHIADALLTSPALDAIVAERVAALAEDEAVVVRVAENIWHDETTVPERQAAALGLHALAAALTERRR